MHARDARRRVRGNDVLPRGLARAARGLDRRRQQRSRGGGHLCRAPERDRHLPPAQRAAYEALQRVVLACDALRELCKVKPGWGRGGLCRSGRSSPGKRSAGDGLRWRHSDRARGSSGRGASRAGQMRLRLSMQAQQMLCSSR